MTNLQCDNKCVPSYKLPNNIYIMYSDKTRVFVNDTLNTFFIDSYVQVHRRYIGTTLGV